MKTINQILTPQDGTLGRWSMWSNDTMRLLDSLRLTPKRHVPVFYEEVEYTSDDGHTWQCQHATGYTETVEWINERREAESGEAQPIYYQTVLVCNYCDAAYSYETEEWS